MIGLDEIFLKNDFHYLCGTLFGWHSEAICDTHTDTCMPISRFIGGEFVCREKKISQKNKQTLAVVAGIADYQASGQSTPD